MEKPMTRVIMIPDDTSIIYTQSSLSAETLMQTINSTGWQSNLEVLESLTLMIDPGKMKASRMGDLVVIYCREREYPVSRMGETPEVRTLSFRQQSILADLCEGFTQKEIALHLGISLRTVGIEVAVLKKTIPSLSTLCRGLRMVPPPSKS
jgi:DNA-binding NarL/FixJ family response regulator